MKPIRIARSSSTPPGEVSEVDRIKITRAVRNGVSIGTLAERYCQTKQAIYRVVVDERIARLTGRKMRFIDDPLYHEPDAGQTIDQIVSAEELPASPRGEELRVRAICLPTCRICIARPCSPRRASGRCS